LPDPLRLPPINALLQYEATRLFVDRAVFSKPGFRLTRANAAKVVEVCRRLDGIPLAIELAAARMKALTIDEIAARLGDRFRLLTSGDRAALPRHQTLRAAMDWSYALLTEPERTLLCRLSVFAGSFTLNAANGVCGHRGTDPRDILDLMIRLVEK